MNLLTSSAFSISRTVRYLITGNSRSGSFGSLSRIKKILGLAGEGKKLQAIPSRDKFVSLKLEGKELFFIALE
jgi:hypothetical protein